MLKVQTFAGVYSVDKCMVCMYGVFTTKTQSCIPPSFPSSPITHRPSQVGCRYLATALSLTHEVRAVSMRFTPMTRDLMSHLTAFPPGPTDDPPPPGTGPGLLSVPELLFNAEGWDPDTLEPLFSQLSQMRGNLHVLPSSGGSAPDATSPDVEPPDQQQPPPRATCNLYISNTEVEPHVAPYLRTCLVRNSTLAVLTLRCCWMAPHVVSALASGLRSNGTLRVVDLRGC